MIIQEIIKNKNIDPYTKEGSALTMIGFCRSGSLGHHELICKDCDHRVYRANSCRNRHCPTCQHKKQYDWINQKKSNALNCKYYHIVATIPDILYHLFLKNQEICYKILMQAAAESVMELCADEKYLGAKVGIIEILHTWKQDMGFHPHDHILVTAGGINKMGEWVEKEGEYLIPVKVLSKKYRGKFLDKLKKEKEKLDLEGYDNWKELIDKLYKKEFVTYIKEPYNDPETVIEYFGRYANRVAITNSRILEYKEGMVTFKYKDRKEGGKEKNITITDEEFVRRFSMHILPKGFRKIRCLGLFANRDLKKRIKEIAIKIQTKMNRKAYEYKMNTICELKCPKCGSKNIIIDYKIEDRIIIKRLQLQIE